MVQYLSISNKITKFIVLIFIIITGSDTSSHNDDNDDDDYNEYLLVEEEMKLAEETCWNDDEEEEEGEHNSSSSSSSSSNASVQDLRGSADDDVVEREKTNTATSKTYDSSNMKPAVHSSRREKISGFAALNEQNIFDAIDYISEESIAKAILAPCCLEECLRKKINPVSRLNFEGAYSKVLDARRQLVGNEWKDKILILKAILQGILNLIFADFLFSLR